MAKASDYGAIADGSTNCARAINLCLQETGVVEFDEGTYIIGSSTLAPGDFLGASIYWGFNAKYMRGIKMIGKGKGKTIIKFANNTLTGNVLPYGFNIFMVNTYSNVGDDQSYDAGDCVISGITFDGNYNNNWDPVNPFFKTVSGVRLIGSNNLIEDCEFKGFGVGVANAEAFALQSYLPSTAADNTQGAIVRNCSFNTPGANSRTVATYIEANTSIAVGGNGIAGKYATGVVIEGCDFTNSLFNTNQRSPLHGITPASTRGCIIRNNTFTNYQGQHIYIDSYKSFNLRIENNTATLCPQFISFVVQNWPRVTGSPFFAPLIGSMVDVTIENNTVGLAGPNSWYYNFNNPPYNASFFLYQYDRDVTALYNPTLIPGFKNINIQGNTITNSAGNDIVYNNGGYWPAVGAYANGAPGGPVPNITDIRVIALPIPPAGPHSWGFKPVTLEPAKSAKPVILNRLVYKSLTVAGFTQNLEAWAGASRIFAIQNISIPNQNFCIRLGQYIQVPTYVITIKWVSQGFVKRYKLWTNGHEVLSYPLYSGEIIPGEGAQFEYWTTSFATRAFSEPFDLETDILEKPDDCCDELGTALANGICQIGVLPNPYPTVYPVDNFYVCPVD